MKLLVLSIDAMFSEDVEKLKSYDALAPFFERALVAKNMAPIYPALTYEDQAGSTCPLRNAQGIEIIA